MARRSKLDKALDDLAERFTPQIKSAFIASVRDVKSQAILNAITAAIDVGDLEAAFRATGLSPAAMRPISAMIERAFETGGVTVANAVPKGLGGAVFRFDVRNSRAEAWLRDHSSELVTRITEDTKNNIRTLVQAGVRDGRNPRNIALDIIGRVNPDTKRREGGVIGLTGPQERWVANARQDLFDLDERYFSREARDKRFDSVVRRAIAEDKPLSAQKVNAIVDRYSDNLLLQRGEMIARTEAIQSLNKSADEAFRQAIDDGTLKANAVKKIWDSSGDNRVRESHRDMDGQTVQMDEPFSTPNGDKLMFPGDGSLGAPGSELIMCRCRVRHEVDWFADLDDDPVPNVPDRAPVPVLDVPIPLADIPPPPLPSRFGYERFVPKKTVAEAQEWMEANITKNARFTKGTKIDGLNTVAQATQEVLERFGMDRLQFIGDPDQMGMGKVRWNASTNAAWADRIKAFLFKNKITDDKKLYEAEYPSDPAAEKRLHDRGVAELERLKTVTRDPERRALMDQMTEIRWSVSPDTRRTTYHEMGHAFHYANKTELEQFIGGVEGVAGWQNLMSKYSGTNLFELVAESFALYMHGDETQFFRINPKLLQYFKMKDRKNVSN